MSAKDTPAPQAAEPGRAQPVEVPGGGHWWRRLLAFAGPGYLVAVGYMDPGNGPPTSPAARNWATCCSR